MLSLVKGTGPGGPVVANVDPSVITTIMQANMTLPVWNVCLFFRIAAEYAQIA
jgi:hypothetical protein